MKTLRLHGNVVPGVNTSLSSFLLRFSFLLLSFWPYFGSSTINPVTVSKTKASSSTSTRLWWLPVTSHYQDSVSFSGAFRMFFNPYWHAIIHSYSSLPYLPLLFTLDRQVVPRFFPCLFHSMHRHRLLGCLGVEELVEHATFLFLTFMARLHHVRTLRVPIRSRIL